MQNTYQEKSLDPIDKDFLFGKKLEGGKIGRAHV